MKRQQQQRQQQQQQQILLTHKKTINHVSFRMRVRALESMEGETPYGIGTIFLRWSGVH